MALSFFIAKTIIILNYSLIFKLIAWLYFYLKKILTGNLNILYDLSIDRCKLKKSQKIIAENLFIL